ncbi:Pentafunctional AROM polypeptide [Fusarium oxysporum f. sp. albedinis]|nr:Pentafunctional AROM polypeptide [Fusarium oxysporum f. sp. albedinis]
MHTVTYRASSALARADWLGADIQELRPGLTAKSDHRALSFIIMQGPSIRTSETATPTTVPPQVNYFLQSIPNNGQLIPTCPGPQRPFGYRIEGE